MKRLPIGMQTFKDVIEGNFYYVDKTPFIKKLIDGSKYYFLSRPRRFGKSMFLDTIESAFRGQKELFKCLYLEDNWDWNTEYPVIKISFGSGVSRSLEELRSSFTYILKTVGVQYDISLSENDLQNRFAELIEKLNKKYDRQVVILIDEYDKPILDSIDNKELASELRDELKNYYSVIKDCDKYIKFCFITGVSKFSKVNLFSGLNNLQDITLRKEYGDICGYTEAELHNVFADRIIDFDKEQVRKWYNGYSFTGEPVYNPFDILLLLESKEFANYWFETGTPTFLIKLLAKNNYFIPDMENIDASSDMLGSFDVDNIEIETLLQQTGYLTIKEKFSRGNRIIYSLAYPNIEVKMSLTNTILKYLSNRNVVKEQNMLFDILYDGELDRLETMFHSFFASIPNDWYRKNQIAKYEGYYASIFYCYFTALGLDVIAEDVTNQGKIDLSVKIEDKIFIIEFKVVDLVNDKNSALEQIKDKKYHEKYLGEGKDLYLVGVEFSKETRNITNFQWESV